MKRIVSFALSVIIALSVFIPVSANEYETHEPIILISGFMCSPLYRDYGLLNQTKVWGPEKSAVKKVVKKEWLSLFRALRKYAKGDEKPLIQVISKAKNEILSPLRCDKDGTPASILSHYPNEPETSNIKYMLSDDDGKYLYEIPFCKYLNSVANGDNIYCFQYDSRLDAVQIANQLKSFIDKLIKYSGSKKVKIFSLSYGGLITGTYLYLYGKENKVSRAVMSVPALGGTDLPDRILRGNIHVDAENLLTFAETATRYGGKVASLFDEFDSEKLDELAGSICETFADIVKYWGSIWCLCSNDKYDELKKDFLDEKENAVFIKNIDFIHYEVMPSFKKLFSSLRKKGMEISIICGYGTSLALGGNLNGDIVLPASGVSGAITSNVDDKLYDDSATVSKFISPDRTLDARTCYLPDNTWFVYGHFHGQYNYENYTRQLVTKLLFTDEIKNVDSSVQFPRFHFSTNKYRVIDTCFDKCAPGYIQSDSYYLDVTNLNEKSPVKVLKIKSNDKSLSFKALTTGFIGAGDSKKIIIKKPYSSSVGEIIKIEVSYFRLGLHPFGKCEFEITVTD